MITLIAPAAPPPARSTASTRPPLRVALVQHRWRPDADELAATLRSGISAAAAEGAQVVFLPEITLLRYPADQPGGADAAALAEDLTGGPTFTLAATAAREHGIFVDADGFVWIAGRAGWPRSGPP